VIDPQKLAELLASLTWRRIIMQIDMFIFNRPPQALSKDVIQGATFAIHTQARTGIQYQLAELRTGELTALVSIPDLRRGLHQRSLCGIQYKGQFQAIGQRPAHDIARIPIQHYYQK